MNRSGLALVGLLAIGAAPPAPAQATYGSYMTGNKLKPICAAAAVTHDTEEAQYCGAYVTGTVDAVVAMEFILHDPIMCIVPGITIDQLVAVSNKYFSDHPESLHEPAGTLIVKAMTEAFPCPKPAR